MSSAPCSECGGPHPTELCGTYVSGVQPRRDPMQPGRIPLGLGDRLGNYWLTRLLGAGSSADVFLGENEVSQAVAAVKVLKVELHDEPAMVKRFESEARVTNLVRHEHVVEIFDIGLHAGWQHFILLEHLDGPTLSHLLKGKLEPSVAVRIVLQLCAVLGAAHAKGVVHRDLKPANVFVLQRAGLPHVKLVDFGMARRENLERGEERTRVGTIVGTALYMSPEQAIGAEADGRSDIYSLGVLMYQLATGRLPFEGNNAVEVMLAHANQAPVPLRKLNPAVSPGYEEVTLRALAKSPHDRWQTMAEVGRAVAAALEGRALPAAPVKTGPKITAPNRPEPPVPSPEVKKSRGEISTQPSAQAAAPTEPDRQSVRREARIATSFGVQLFNEQGQLLGDAIVTDVSTGGAFIRTQLSPSLFSRVRVAGLSSAGTIDVSGEVVRLSLGEPRGFGMRFDALRPDQLPVFEVLCRPRSAQEGDLGDPIAEAELRMFEARTGDLYALLGVPSDSSNRRIRDVCERLAEEMAPARFPKLSPGQASRFVALRLRLAEADEVLIDPARRALYDAVNGNVLGVLRCITEGLDLERLDGLRLEFIKVRPDADTLTRPALNRADQAERAGDLGKALRALADALCHDPLNLALHHRAADLRARARTGNRP